MTLLSTESRIDLYTAFGCTALFLLVVSASARRVFR